MDDLAITKDAASALREFVITDEAVAAASADIIDQLKDYPNLPPTERKIVQVSLSVSVKFMAADGGCICARYLATDSGNRSVALGEVQI